jgi:hypothetical protein
MTNQASSMYLVQLLLPVTDNNKQRFPASFFAEVRDELTQRFGGVTAFLRSPADGLWKEGEDKVEHNEVAMFEVVTAELDRKWWLDYRTELQKKFRQQELLFWAMNVTRL